MEMGMAELLEFGYLTPAQADHVRTQVRALLTAIRPDAVALVLNSVFVSFFDLHQTDAFNFSDHMLGSALGRYDGKVYEAMYQHAKNDPLTLHAPMSPFISHL
jgi:acyl-CoA oxidase